MVTEEHQRIVEEFLDGARKYDESIGDYYYPTLGMVTGVEIYWNATVWDGL